MGGERSKKSTQRRAGQIAAAVLGAPSAAVLVALALVARLPMDSEVRLLVAEFGVFPLMIIGVCAALLSQSGLRAWAGCALASALSGAALILAP